MKQVEYERSIILICTGMRPISGPPIASRVLSLVVTYASEASQGSLHCRPQHFVLESEGKLHEIGLNMRWQGDGRPAMSTERRRGRWSPIVSFFSPNRWWRQNSKSVNFSNFASESDNLRTRCVKKDAKGTKLVRRFYFQVRMNYDSTVFQAGRRIKR